MFLPGAETPWHLQLGNKKKNALEVKKKTHFLSSKMSERGSLTDQTTLRRCLLGEHVHYILTSLIFCSVKAWFWNTEGGTEAG